MKMFSTGLIVISLVGFVAAHEGEHRHEQAKTASASQTNARKVLGPGTYMATVKSLVCSACGPKVLETLKAVSGISDASVDQATSRLTFVVKPGAKVNVAAVQNKLKEVSSRMGMGADYSLRDIMPVPSAQ
jgi:hypothetical protein